MKCPYCSNTMIAGNLIGDRYANNQESDDPNSKAIYIYLKRGSYFKWKSIQNQAFVCPTCNKMIIDLEVDKNRSKYQ